MTEYPYPYTTPEGKVICQICGKPYLVISPKHLTKHNITYSEYKIRFPDAPLSSKEFAAKGKYGKEKHLFVKETIDEMEADEVPVNEPIVEDEIDFEKVMRENPVNPDMCNTHKDKILDHLRSFFTNIKKDYMIQVFSIDNRMIYEAISDFSDPVLKITIDFPNTFWHNRALYDDPTKEKKLKEFGWKVVKINGKSPSFKKITKIIESL